MATARPFAYNPGATGPIPGTEQVGSLAIGTPTVGFSATGLEWWNGPDEDPGYVIAQSVPGDTQPTPVFGVSASVGFFRSSVLTDPSFISLANVIAGPSGPFASGSAAKTWLNANGYWTSYAGATGAGWLFYAATGPLVDPPPTSDGQAIFTDNTGGGTDVTYNPNKSGGVDFLNFNLQDTDGVDYTTQFTTLQNSGGTVSVSQGSNTATYVLTTGMANINPSGFAAINTAAATQTVNASSSFVFGTPITIAFS